MEEECLIDIAGVILKKFFLIYCSIFVLGKGGFSLDQIFPMKKSRISGSTMIPLYRFA
jgi:hypothetical protein